MFTETLNLKQLDSNENKNDSLSDITPENMDYFLEKHFESLNEKVSKHIKIKKLISVGTFGRVICFYIISIYFDNSSTYSYSFKYKKQ